METNASLDSKGLNEHEKALYWDGLSAARAGNKADTDRAAIRTAYDQTITDCTTIINTSNPTEAQQTWAIKRLAEMVRDAYKFHRTEIKDV